MNMITIGRTSLVSAALMMSLAASTASAQVPHSANAAHSSIAAGDFGPRVVAGPV